MTYLPLPNRGRSAPMFKCPEQFVARILPHGKNTRCQAWTAFLRSILRFLTFRSWQAVHLPRFDRRSWTASERGDFCLRIRQTCTPVIRRPHLVLPRLAPRMTAISNYHTTHQKSTPTFPTALPPVSSHTPPFAFPAFCAGVAWTAAFLSHPPRLPPSFLAAGQQAACKTTGQHPSN